MQWCRLLIFLVIQMNLVQCTSSTSRTEDNLTKFTMAGGPKSHLFSQCIADSMTVEGDLYSIGVSEDEAYVRFVPDQTFPMVWTDVDLGMDSSIIGCSQVAYNLRAYMFKYDDGSCRVTLKDSYNPSSVQGCDGADEDIVYISSRDMNFFGDVLVTEEPFGCLTKTDDGWEYGVEDGRVVDENTLPRRDTCCQSAAEFCLVAECTDEPMTYCEAEARCLARGLRAASRSFHENVDAVDPTKLGTDEYYFWVNVYQELEDVWKWQDDGSDFSDYVWWGGPINITATQPPPTKNCAAIHFTDKPHRIEYYRTGCNDTEVKCILCNDPNGILPAC
ncbi:C-type lectin fold [Trinorchestia longiramus]|nr:C-type lectin fold [Trinorchestia longiramus]